MKINDKRKKTAGQISSELSLKTPETRDPIELQREMHKDYEKHMQICIDTSLKEFVGDFFIIVITKKERLMQNILRNYFFGRETCPSPDYDQTVYKYDRGSDTIQFIWVVPSKDTCVLLKENAMHVVPEERILRDFVLDFADGTLFKKMKKLNGEKYDSPLLDKTKKTIIKGV